MCLVQQSHSYERKNKPHKHPGIAGTQMPSELGHPAVQWQ